MDSPSSSPKSSGTLPYKRRRHESEVALITLSPEFEIAFKELAREQVASGVEGYQFALSLIDKEGFDAYLKLLEEDEKGINLPDGIVPASTFFLIRHDGRMIGRSDLRHRLTDSLRRVGGHIGYDVRASERGQGYGTLILKLTLDKARDRGFQRVLLTCDADNVASSRIIEKNGGVLHDREVLEETGKEKLRFWIEIS